MTHAFIVIVELDDATDTEETAVEMQKDLSDFDVVSIHPWGAMPSTAMPAPNPPGIY